MLTLPDDPPRSGGPTCDFVLNEIKRTGAPATELKSALAFVAGSAGFDARAYDALSPRMRRLVDLVGAAGDRIPATAFDLA